LIATQFSVLPVRWRLHYLSSLGLAGLSFALIVFAFRGKAEKDLLPQPQPRLVDVGVRSPRNDTTESASENQDKEMGREVDKGLLDEGEETTNDASGNLNANAETWNKMTRIMRNRAVHALAMWAFMYTGTEVSLGGWVLVQASLDERILKTF
jgi:hypothetical protein